MFEKFFNKSPQESGPKGLLPNFIEDPKVQSYVTQCAKAWRNAYAYTHDGQLDEAKKYQDELDQLLEEYRDEIQSYLQPYIDLGTEKLKGYAQGEENDRRQVATMFL